MADASQQPRQAQITQRLLAKVEPESKPFEIRDTKLPGLILRVQPSGWQSYYVQYDRGKRMKIGNARVVTLGQARNKAKEILGQAAAGDDPAQEKRKRNASTLRKFVDGVYRPWCVVNRKHGDDYCDRILRVFTDIADKRLDDVTLAAVERVRTARQKAGRAPTTINRDTACLSGALSYAVRMDYLAKHPLARLEALSVDSSPKVRYLSEDEASRLYAALQQRDDNLRAGRVRGNEWRAARDYPLMPTIPADGYGDHITPLVLLSLNTGIRRGEAFSLEWQDVDFELRQLTVRGATSKRNKTRHIPLNAVALGALQRWRKQSIGRLVFPARDGGRLSNVSKSWAHVLRDANIQRFRWHDMRHTFASWLVMRGVDLNTVRDLLGHGGTQMTLRYAHLAPAHKAEAVARLE